MSATTPIYMTPKCSASMRAELNHLLYKERPFITDCVTIAAAHGDRSENADYHYNKKKLRQIDSRIHFLTKRLESAEIIDPVAQAAIANGRVLFGCTVTVEDEDGNEKTYRIVGVDEYDATRGLVSWVSPIGKALLKSQEGDLVVFNAPNGKRELEILKVEYLAID